MATTVAKLQAILDADTRSFDRKLKGADSTTKKFSIAAKAALIGGVGAGLYAVGKAAKIGWDEYNQGAKVAAQTNAVLKSTGGIANVTADDVENLGHALMLKSGIDDEVIKSGENMLLTFKGIRNELGKGNDIFDQATKLTLDMSVAMGKDLNSSAVMVGKALNDPIKGLTALTRVGVTFTDQQKEQITRLVENGKAMEAQKIILGELSSEFGGSATAAGKTFAGQLNILHERFNNFMGDIVEKGIPILQRFAQWLDPKITASIKAVRELMLVWQKNIEKVTQALGRHEDSIQTVARVLEVLGKVLKVVISIQMFWARVIGTIWVNEIKVAVGAIRLLIGLVKILGNVAQAVGNGIARVFRALAPAIRVVFAPVFELISLLQRAYDIANKLLSILPSVGGGSGGGPGESGGRFGNRNTQRTTQRAPRLALGGGVTVHLHGTLINERAGEEVVRMLRNWERRGGR